jgi:diacylglycerol kinase (ATP)
MRLRLIVNPTARSGRGAAYLDAALPVLRRAGGGEPEVVASRSAAHVAALAAEIAPDPDATVVICGGDGSLYAAVQGMVGARAALGVLPFGTGNDFATCLGIPADPVGAAEVIAAGRVRLIDLGRAEPAVGGGPAIHFNCVAGVGLDADGIRHLRRVPWLTGNIKYAYGALRALWGWRPRRVRLRADDAGYDGPLMTVSIANTPTYGGGMKMTPDARMDDGLLDLCIIGQVPRGQLLRLMPEVYSGGHVGRPGVHVMRGRTVTVEADRPIPVCLDGELTELTTPAKFTVLPGALRVPAPAVGAAR